jgi:hypothetical protein
MVNAKRNFMSELVGLLVRNRDDFARCELPRREIAPERGRRLVRAWNWKAAELD